MFSMIGPDGVKKSFKGWGGGELHCCHMMKDELADEHLAIPEFFLKKTFQIQAQLHQYKLCRLK